MADFRRVTDTFSVAPQLVPEEMAEAAALGFKLVINNRPDGEAPGQPTDVQMQAAAKAAGLDYVHIPIGPTSGPAQAQAMHAAVAGASGPVLAFCRSGTRSITYWARGQHAAGVSRDGLVTTARQAGYDLSGAL